MSYAVMNRGDHPVRVRLEISPNNLDYSTDLEETIAPKEMKVLVPNRFLKWTRICAAVGGENKPPSQIDVYAQAQSIGIR